MRRGVLLGLMALLVAHALYLGCVAEDAHISFRFSRNLAEGHGFVWNVGEPPVEGYTNFLWVVLGALALRVGVSLPLFSQALGILSGISTLPLVYALGVEALGLGSIAALSACAFLAICGPFAAWASGGMETSLFTLLVTAGLYFACTRRSDSSAARATTAYACLTLATLTRPEGFLIFVIVLLRDLATAQSAAQRSRRLRPALLAYVLPGAAYFVWRFRYFGWLLPNTFYAKTGGGLDQALRGASYTGYFALHFVLPMALLFAAYLGRTSFSPEADERARPASPARLTLLVVLSCYTAYIVGVGGDYMAMYRFFVPVLPVFYLLSALPLDRLVKSARDVRAQRALAALLLGAGALTFLQSTPLERKLFQKPALQHGTYGGIVIERWHVARLTLLAHFFESKRSAAQDSVGTQAIGVIGDLTSLQVYGFHGLVDPVIAHGTRVAQPLGQGLPGHEKQDPARVLTYRPTWFMFSRFLTRKPMDYPSYDAETDAVLHRDYRLASEWLEDRENGEAGYFTYLERSPR